MQNNSRGVAAAMTGYRFKRNWVWGDEFSFTGADNVPEKKRSVLGWETLYRHNADRKHHHPTEQHTYNKGAYWALLPFPEGILCSYLCHPVSLTSGPCLRGCLTNSALSWSVLMEEAGRRSPGHARTRWKCALRYRCLCLSPVLFSWTLWLQWANIPTSSLL